jgi:hypothetical protein
VRGDGGDGGQGSRLIDVFLSRRTGRVDTDAGGQGDGVYALVGADGEGERAGVVWLDVGGEARDGARASAGGAHRGRGGLGGAGDGGARGGGEDGGGGDLVAEFAAETLELGASLGGVGCVRERGAGCGRGGVGDDGGGKGEHGAARRQRGRVRGGGGGGELEERGQVGRFALAPGGLGVGGCGGVSVGK